MKVLVTGGAGFIGSNAVKLLESKGAQTIIVDNFSHANYKNIEGLNSEVICADIVDENMYKKLPKVDAVIHEAAITDTTLTDNKKMVMVNYEGFKNIVSFCAKHKAKLVYASSAGVYGNSSSAMKEDQVTGQHNTYGFSKYLCDLYNLRKIRGQSVLPLIVGLRYFNVYGPGEYHKGSAASMIYQLYQQMSNYKPPRVFKSGEQKRDFVYVKDVVSVTVGALELKKDVILNVGTGVPRSFNEIISILNKLLKTSLETDYFDNPYAGVYQDYTRADVSLLKDNGFVCEHSLEEGITDYVRKHLDINVSAL